MAQLCRHELLSPSTIVKKCWSLSWLISLVPLDRGVRQSIQYSGMDVFCLLVGSISAQYSCSRTKFWGRQTVHYACVAFDGWIVNSDASGILSTNINISFFRVSQLTLAHATCVIKVIGAPFAGGLAGIHS